MKTQDAKNTSEKAPEPYMIGSGATIVSKSILAGQSKLRWLFRQKLERGNGWVAFGDTDTQEYLDDARNLSIVDFRTLAEIEPLVSYVFPLPVGADLELRSDKTGRYFVDTRTGQEYREPVKPPAMLAFEKNLQFLNRESYPSAFFAGLFEQSDSLRPFVLGEADFPTGEIVLADPLAYLGSRYQTVLEQKVPPGRYTVELSAVLSPMVGPRIAAARLRLRDGEVSRYELAMPKGKQLGDLGSPGVFTFFGVDTGLACITDSELAEQFAHFRAGWSQENPQGNLYTDYFQPAWEACRRPVPGIPGFAGEHVLWPLPEGGGVLPFFSSGMGDGIYSGYWGFSPDGELAELVVPFMNPAFFTAG